MSDLVDDEDRRLCIVGVGASAGGLEAIREMLASANPETNLAYVVIQHLDPNHESLLAELLGRQTALDAQQVSGGPLHLTLASEGALPLAHVTQVAKALVSAALTAPEGVEALNVVDDDLPTRGRFVAAHRRAAGWPRVALSLPWTAWLGLARALRPVSAHLPGLLREPVLRARILPLQWPNTALRARLGGQDDAPFEEMLRRSLEGRA